MTDTCVIELPERVDIACVEALHLTLEDALGTGKPVQLHGANVTKLDTAGIQVIGAFFAEATKHHQEVVWLEPSKTIREVLTFLQMSPELGLDEQEQINE